MAPKSCKSTRKQSASAASYSAASSMQQLRASSGSGASASSSTAAPGAQQSQGSSGPVRPRSSDYKTKKNMKRLFEKWLPGEQYDGILFAEVCAMYPRGSMGFSEEDKLAIIDYYRQLKSRRDQGLEPFGVRLISRHCPDGFWYENMSESTGTPRDLSSLPTELVYERFCELQALRAHVDSEFLRVHRYLVQSGFLDDRGLSGRELLRHEDGLFLSSSDDSS
eukprot:TRINITY_DN64098_c0_g1_i1.p1 TRINITY_DN64098_c0_g1~~TRINITY_DN64098_c0_g1_i1.p1  ORF type:complete len:222 (-),score=34.04 TRINITY_DN64098_c0_g1_i1:176-841(-)